MELNRREASVAPTPHAAEKDQLAVSDHSLPPEPSVRDELHRLLSLSAKRDHADLRRIAVLSATLRANEHRAGRKWEDEDTSELNALLGEYATLRQESMNTINNRTQILMLGLAAIAAFAGGSLTSERLTTNTLFVSVVFSVAVPVVCVFVFFVWMSEAIRCHRVGYYLASSVEARINEKLGRLVVTWEAALWTSLPRDEMGGPSVMALGLVGLIATAAPWLGLIVNEAPIVFRNLASYEIVIPYALYALAAAYALRIMSRLKNIPVLRSPIDFQD